MAYTVQHLYEKVLEGTDKMGSDFFTLPYVMNRLEAATYDLIGETVKFIENTQEIKDDIKSLYKPFNISVVADPNDSSYMSVAIPDDYLHLMSAKVVDANVEVRDTRIIRHGQDEIYEANPNTKASAEYPIIVLYGDVMRIKSTGNPTSIRGFYVMKPVFGKYSVHDDPEVEIAVNLPDNVVDKIIKNIINDIFVSTGDPRAPIQYQMKETYRQRGK